MSYQVLARKWRPQFFKDMVGQEHVLRALINALDNQRLHHAYLFTGTRGVGKTTIARILAKCLNCEEGISSEPCGVCNSCKEISEGRFVDLIEVDAASRTKVEDTREILDNVQYAPTRGRYKVYLIDEVHMLSNHSFNALLKTLEEPPPHVKFLLATTDPQKLPVTILSRCLQFSLKNMTPERIVGYLKTVLAEEQVNFEEPGLWLLGRAAEGSMRDALSLTDQSIAFGEGQIKEQDVATMLGTVDRGRVFQLAVSLAENNAPEAMALIAQMAEHAVDFNNLLADLISLLHRIAIAQAVPEAVDNSQGDKEQVMALAQSMSPAHVQLVYQIALTGKRDLPLAPDPRSGMEMTLLRMINFAPVGEGVPLPQPSQGAAQGAVKKPELAQLKRSVVTETAPSDQASISTSSDRTSEASVPEMDSGAEQADPVQESAAAVSAPVSEPEQTAKSQNVAQSESAKPIDPPPWNDDPVVDTTPVPQGFADHGDVAVAEPPPVVSQAVAQPIENTATAQLMDRQSDRQQNQQPAQPAVQAEVRAEVQSRPSIHEMMAAASEKAEPVLKAEPEAKPVENQTPEQPAVDYSELLAMPLSPDSWPLIFPALPLEGMLRNLAANTCLVQMNGDELVFHSDAGHMRLFGQPHQQKFAQILNEALGQSYRLQVLEGQMLHETPAQRVQRLQAERLAEAVQAIESDVNVQALRQAFNGQVIMDSIKPIDH